jgi:hypothetical protein
MRRAAAMATAASAGTGSALSSLNNNANSSSSTNRPPSSPNDASSSSSTHMHQQLSQTHTILGPQRRRHRATPADNFHPRLITAQILSLQCFHYTIQGFLFQVNFLLYNTSITIDRIFTDQYVQLWHPAGWPDVAAIFFSALFGYVLPYHETSFF